MNRYTFIALIVICGLVLADDCTTLATESTCTANTSCAYTSTGGSCANKCNTMTKTDCEATANTSNCVSTAEFCGYISDCTTNASNETNCKAAKDSSNAALCTWTAGSVAGCAFKGTALEQTCNGKVADKATCENPATQCVFTDAVFSKCDYKAGVCTTKTDAANCNTSYCTKVTTVCQSDYKKVTGECSALTATGQTACTDQATKGCAWVNSACVDNCSQYTTDTTCTAGNSGSGCNILTPYSCSDKPTEGSTACDTNKTAASCTSEFCKITNTSEASCKPVANFCSKNDQAGCTDTTNCQYNTAVASTCVNKVSDATCKAINTGETACKANAGCKWNPWNCSNATTKKCAATDSATDCGATTKFCTFTATGTCATKSFSTILIAASSLLVTFALL